MGPTRAIGEMDQEFMFQYGLHAVNMQSKVWKVL